MTIDDPESRKPRPGPSSASGTQTAREDASNESQDNPLCGVDESFEEPQDTPSPKADESSEEDPQPSTSRTPAEPMVEELTYWEKVTKTISSVLSRGKAVQGIRTRVDAIKSASDVVELARMDWIEEAFHVTKFALPEHMNKDRFRVIIAADSREDKNFFASICFGKHEYRLAAKVSPRNATCLTSKYTGARPAGDRIFLKDKSVLNIIFGKVGQDSGIVFETAHMLMRMTKRLRELRAEMDAKRLDTEKVERLAVRLPHAIDDFTGRKLVECAWKDLGIKVDYIVTRSELLESAPRSRLYNMTIRAGALNVLTFQSIFESLKQRVRPSAHGIEVHKVMYLHTGDILLRIKEIRAGGKESYANDVRRLLGLTSFFS